MVGSVSIYLSSNEDVYFIGIIFLKFCIALPFTWKIHCTYHLLFSAKIELKELKNS